MVMNFQTWSQLHCCCWYKRLTVLLVVQDARSQPAVVPVRVHQGQCQQGESQQSRLHLPIPCLPDLVHCSCTWHPGSCLYFVPVCVHCQSPSSCSHCVVTQAPKLAWHFSFYTPACMLAPSLWLAYLQSLLRLACHVSWWSHSALGISSLPACLRPVLKLIKPTQPTEFGCSQ